MSYKESCKKEGEIITKIKIARAYFKDKKKKKNIAKHFSCHKNTIGKIIKLCKRKAPFFSYKLVK